MVVAGLQPWKIYDFHEMIQFVYIYLKVCLTLQQRYFENPDLC